MIEYTSSLVAMLGVSAVLPVVVAVAAASWRRDTAPTSAIAVRARKHSVPATGMFGDGPSGTVPADAPIQLRVLDLSGRRP